MNIQLANPKQPKHFYFVYDKVVKKQLHFEVEALVFVQPDPEADGDNEPWFVFEPKTGLKKECKRVMDIHDFRTWYHDRMQEGWIVAAD
jgi:hypothetical protein